jgi:gamma-glutamyltranspeptidase/glutathione hydrolase
VDNQRNAISLINSIFDSFGSGLMTPQSGILLQNRGSGFVIDPDHPNCIAPKKRPLHTIIPGMLVQQNQVIMPFGVMGGHYQPTGHTHLITNLLDYGMDPQAALDLARVFSFDGLCRVERGIPAAVVEQLAAKGHAIVPADEPLGGGQAIWIDRSAGVLMGGSDPRKDGFALGY